MSSAGGHGLRRHRGQGPARPAGRIVVVIPHGNPHVEKFKSLQLPVQLVITLVVMLVILGVGYKYFPNIAALNEEIKGKRATLDALNAEIAKGINLEKKLPELEREIANLEAQLEELKTIMPPARVDSEIVSKLESVAKRSRLAIRQLVPGRTRKKDFYDEYPISIDVSANYHDLAKFFDRVAHLPRIFNISGVTLKQIRAGGPGVAAYSIDASFTAVTFIYREDEPPPPPAPKPAAAPAPKESDDLSG
jgi:type IV pilus assembly protein PilO